MGQCIMRSKEQVRVQLLPCFMKSCTSGYENHEHRLSELCKSCTTPQLPVTHGCSEEALHQAQLPQPGERALWLGAGVAA